MTKITPKVKGEIRTITSALPYINNIPHLGHIIGSHLPADIFARFCRARGYETIFVGGTDENGSTTEISAEKLNLDIEKFSKKLHEEHKKIYDWFEISYDNFSRTVKPIHHKTTQEFFEKINANGYIKKGKMKVFYSEKDNRFLPDRYVIGECPKCGYPDANGDQCEKCTSVLEPTQLKNPRSAVSGSKIEIRESEHLFLDLKKLSPKLEKWIKSNKHWRKQVSNLALGWIKDGLKERCITRDLKHGVKVPLKGFEDKVFYVWFDAPIGYVSSTKEATKDWKKFWTSGSKTGETKIYHFLGKDNIPFHTIFWPGILMAEGEYNLPYQVVGLQYLNYEGGKFSKSKKHGVFCEKLPETGISPDYFRAYLAMIIPETGDSEFKWSEFQERINSDLIGNYGNYLNRILTFIDSKLKSEIKKPTEKDLTKEDKEFIKQCEAKAKEITESFEACELRKAFSEILSLSSIGNKYFNDQKPWEKIKEKNGEERASHVLYLCASLAKNLTILLAPFIPNTTVKACRFLNLEKPINLPEIWDETFKIEISNKKSHKINKPERLFEVLTDEKIKEIREIVSNPTDVKDLF